jgi:hypothetical protein
MILRYNIEHAMTEAGTRRQWRTQEFFFGEGGSTISVEDRGQIERGSGSGSPLGRDSAQFANGRNPYSY